MFVPIARSLTKLAPPLSFAQQQCHIPADEQVLLHNNVELQDPKSTLEGNNVAPDDILTLQRRSKRQRTNISTVGPGSGSGPTVRPGQISEGGGNPHDAEQIRQHVLSNPSMLRQLREVKMGQRQKAL